MPRARRDQRLSDEKHDSAQPALLADLGSIGLIEVRPRLVTMAAPGSLDLRRTLGLGGGVDHYTASDVDGGSASNGWPFVPLFHGNVGYAF